MIDKTDKNQDSASNSVTVTVSLPLFLHHSSASNSVRACDSWWKDPLSKDSLQMDSSWKDNIFEVTRLWVYKVPHFHRLTLLRKKSRDLIQSINFSNFANIKELPDVLFLQCLSAFWKKYDESIRQWVFRQRVVHLSVTVSFPSSSTILDGSIRDDV